jgi:acyl-coenzyme A synthetase/AMP-(fatty) acid ligase
MHPPEGAAWLVWIETSGLAVAMRQWRWLYPIVEILHILGFVVVVGAGFFFDLRLLGLGRGLPVSALARHLLARARAAFLVVAPTGLMMFAAHATEFATNPAFQLKLLLIAGAIANAAAFHRWPFRSVAAWDVGVPTPGRARAAAVLSLALWTGTICCGRLLAYF